MSRLGKTPIKLPKNIELKQHATKISVKGPKGELHLDVHPALTLSQEGELATLHASEVGGIEGREHGLYRALLCNLIKGVTTGFEKRLTLIGVGYRAQLKGNEIELSLGFSHPVTLKIPAGVKVDIEKSVNILISGLDKQLVGQFAADVRSTRPPEPYKGKGIRYVDEFVRKKAGKAAKGK